MYFKNIIGHTEQKKLIRQMVNSGNTPHAQIFHGPSGVGKLIFARAFASYLLCQDKKLDDSCGICSACIKSHKLIHPDVHFTFPTIGLNVLPSQMMVQWRSVLHENPFSTYHDWLKSIGGENKQGNINKEACNQMIKVLGLKSFESKQKIWIIWGGEYLGKEGNRLLKLIEEPPDETFIIILMDDIEQVLGTIRSRCQSLKLNYLADEEISQNLRNWSDADQEKIEAAAIMSDGSVAAALNILSESNNPFNALWLEWIKKVITDEVYEISLMTDEVAKLNKEQQKYFAQYALFFMREVFVLKTMPGYKSKLDKIPGTAAKRLSEYWNLNAIEEIINHLNDLQIGIIRNGNIKILLFDTYLQIRAASKKILVAEVKN